MANGSKVTNEGLKIFLNRTFKEIPDYTTPTVFSVGTGTTTPQVTDTDLDTKVNINGGDTKAFVSGYPTLDETNLQVTIRCFLNTLEANGNDISEFGLFNADTTPKMYSRAVFTALNKSSTVEITFVQKDKLT